MAKSHINEAKINIASNNPLADGRCKLMLVFSYKGNRLRMDTGERCLPDHFDKSRQLTTRAHPFQHETNAILAKLANDVVSEYKKNIAKGKIPTPTELKDAVKPKNTIDIKNLSMADYFDLNERHQISKGNARTTKYNYRTLQNMFSKYEKEKKEKIELHTFDEIVHTKFINWCIYELDNIPNTIAKRNGFIKSFFGFCERNGANVNSFYKEIKVKKVNPEMIFLTESELKKIEDLEIDSYLEKTKDCFLFSCYTGLRYSDIKALTLDHISLQGETYVINIYQEKTKKKISIALSDKAVELMDKYKNNVLRSQKNKYFLPVITNQKLNAYLKELGQIAGVDTSVEKLVYYKGDITMEIVPKYELLTFHKARHTFATLSLQRGMPLAALQKILGHSRMEETMVYAKVVESYQHDQLLKVWNVEENKVEVDKKETKYQDADTMDFEQAKIYLLKLAEQGENKAKFYKAFSSETIQNLSDMGFVILQATPIEKLKGLYYIISW